MVPKPKEAFIKMLETIIEQEDLTTDIPLRELIEDVKMGNDRIMVTTLIEKMFLAGMSIDRIIYWLRKFGIITDVSLELRFAIESIIKKIERGEHIE